MNRNAIIATALATILGVGAVAGAAAKSQGKDEGEAREIATVLSARSTLAQAIAAAEAKGGGHAIRAGAEDEHGKVDYVVTTTDGRRRFEWRVDTVSGAVRSLADEDDGHEPDDGVDPSSPPAISLRTAIDLAERHAGGKALEAEYEHEDGTTVIDVEVVHPRGAVEKVVIDATSGKVLAGNG